MKYKVEFDDSVCDLFVRNQTVIRITLENGIFHREAVSNLTVHNPEALALYAEAIVASLLDRDYSLEESLVNYSYLPLGRFWNVVYKDSMRIVPEELLEDQPAFQFWMDRKMRNK